MTQRAVFLHTLAASDLLALLALPLRQLTDLVLPPRFPAYRAIVDGDGRICVDCWLQLEFVTAPLCAICGTPFGHDRGAEAECGACLVEPPRFKMARAALADGEAVQSVLLAMKHGDRQHMARVMAPRAAGGRLAGEVVLTPAPLKRWRLWERGSNQAAVLALESARLSGAAADVDALVRVKATKPSIGIGRKVRANDVRGAFYVVDKNPIKERIIVFIGDVLTTGATAEACAQHLRRAGTSNVHVW